MPASLTLTAEPTALAEKGTGLEVYASLRTADGAGLAGRSLRVRAAGARLDRPVTDLKGGDYRASLTADGGTDVLVHVVALSPASRNAAEHVVVVPSRPAVAPGGQQALTIVTTDAFGYPVPDVPVRLVALDGGGSVPAAVTTDASGLAEVTFRAGDVAGIATVEARAGHAVAARSFWQASLPDAPPLPLSGTVEHRMVTAAWEASQASVYVEREGGADAPALGGGGPPAGGLAALSITLDPTTAMAGSDVQVTVRAADAAGAPARAESVELFATGGARISPVTPLGDGLFVAMVSIPVDADEAVKVNAVADGGKALATVQIPVTPAAAPVLDDEPAAVAARPERTRLPEIARPHLRVKAAALLSTYSFEQIPADDSGGLLDTTLGWGGPRGGAPMPVGLETAVRGFLPMLPYLGLDASFRWSRYAVSSALFTDEAVDNLFAVRADIVGRYPFAIGRDQLHVGARVGFRYDDFVTFRGCLRPGCTVTYEPLALPGLDTGLELGAEFWRMFLVASGSAGFAYGSQPYAANADLELGYNITRHVFVALGFGYQWRHVALENEAGEVRGSLSDQQILGTLGVGFSL